MPIDRTTRTLARVGSIPPSVFIRCKAKFIPYELKCDIARMVRAFELSPMVICRVATVCCALDTGGYYEGYACGHLWIEVDDDIVDFCSGHWVAEAQMLYETTTDPDDRKLGPVAEFIWQAPHSLKASWRPRGPWSGRSPNYGVYDRLIKDIPPLIREFVANATPEAGCRITRA